MVAEELHFGRAAARLHLAQPPLSRQIQVLEQEIAVRLFHRTKRRVELTEAGRVFLEHARTVLQQADEAVLAAQRAARGQTGFLSIGFVGSAAFEVLPAVLQVFRGEAPQVELALHEMHSAAQTQALLGRRIQVGFLRPGVHDRSLTAEVVRREHLLAALPRDHRLADEAVVPLESLATDGFIVFPREPHPSFTDQVFHLCAQAGFAPRVAQEVLEMQTTISLVSAGIGVALVPASVQTLSIGGVIYRPLPRPSPVTELQIAYNPTAMTPVVERFLGVVRRLVQEHTWVEGI